MQQNPLLNICFNYTIIHIYYFSQHLTIYRNFSKVYSESTFGSTHGLLEKAIYDINLKGYKTPLRRVFELILINVINHICFQVIDDLSSIGFEKGDTTTIGSLVLQPR